MRNIIIVLACDFRNYGGEGVLAREFLKKISYQNKQTTYQVISPSIKSYLQAGKFVNEIEFNNKVNYESLFHKYILPIIYISKATFILRKHKVLYLNYIPLWNFLIFLIKGRNVDLGQIVSSENDIRFKLSFNNIVRNFFFPLFEKLTFFIIKKKKIKNLVCATPITFEKFKKYEANAIDGLFLPKLNKSLNLINEKLYDFCIYYRDHPTRYPLHTLGLINYLSKKHKIAVIGNLKYKTKNKNIVLKSNLSREEALKVLKHSNTFINVGDNGYSLMSREAIILGVELILYSPSKNLDNHINYLKKKYKVKIKKITEILDLTKIKN